MFTRQKTLNVHGIKDCKATSYVKEVVVSFRLLTTNFSFYPVLIKQPAIHLNPSSQYQNLKIPFGKHLSGPHRS